MRTLSAKAIVLDLDQTLVATQDDWSILDRIMTDPRWLSLRTRLYLCEVEDTEDRGRGQWYRFWGVVRPGTEAFLRFCFTYFRYVIVWSAGRRAYVEALVTHLFRDLPEPHLILTYDNIKYNRAGQIVKPLTTLIALAQARGYHLNLDEIIALDDTPSTFSENRRQGCLISGYDPTHPVEMLAPDQRLDLLRACLMARGTDERPSSDIKWPEQLAN